MGLSELLLNGRKVAAQNSSQILTGLGVTGVVSTAYLAAKGGFRSASYMTSEDRDLPLTDKAKLVWKFYIPAAASGTATVVAIVGASRSGAKRTAAAVSAYSLTEKAFSEYREKVVEEIGSNKESKIKASVAESRVNSDIPTGSVLVTGSGDVLCCELYTDRYFRSTVEALRKAENEVNSRALRELYVTLDEFYDILNLTHTTDSNSKGWTSEKLMELSLIPVMSPTGEPCVAFEYNYVKPL